MKLSAITSAVIASHLSEVDSIVANILDSDGPTVSTHHIKAAIAGVRAMVSARSIRPASLTHVQAAIVQLCIENSTYMFDHNISPFSDEAVAIDQLYTLSAIAAFQPAVAA